MTPRRIAKCTAASTPGSSSRGTTSSGRSPRVSSWKSFSKWGEGTSGGDARRRADEMLDRLGLEKNKNKKPAQLSGGEKQTRRHRSLPGEKPVVHVRRRTDERLDWENGQK